MLPRVDAVREGAGIGPQQVVERISAGRVFDEETLVRVGGVIESSANFTAKPAGY